MKQKIILAVSILAGVIAFWLTSRYLQNQRDEFEKARQEMYSGEEKIEVLTVLNDLPAGMVIAQKDLAKKTASKRDLGDKAVLVTDKHLVLGKKLKYALSREETLMWADLDMPYLPGSGLAPTIKSGLRAVSVSVGGAAAVSGLVQPNDRVDVLGTFSFPSKHAAGEMETVTLTVLQDVTVLATGQMLARQLGSGADQRHGGGSYSTVTFEVTPREAELLVFAENMRGRLTLLLRHPEDVSYESNLPEINFQYLEQKLPDLNQYRQKNIRHKQDL